MKDYRIELFKERSFSELISVTFEFIRLNFKPLIRSLLYIAGPAIIIVSGVIIHLAGRILYWIKSSAQQIDISEDSILIESILYGFVLMLISFCVVVLLLGITHAFIEFYKDNKIITVESVWSHCKINFIKIAFRYFSSLVVIVLPALIVVVPLILILAFIPIIGQLIFMIVGAALGTLFILTIVTSLMENNGIVDSLKLTITRLKGSFTQAVGFHFIINLIANFTSLIFIIPIYIVMIFYFLHSVQNTNVPTFDFPIYMQIILSLLFILFIVSTVIMYSFQLIGISFLYFSLKEKKEATGLMSRIQNIGQTESKPRDEHY
jgi:hypothetical protein